MRTYFKSILWILFIFNRRLYQVEGVYSAAKETEIRGETILAADYDVVSRPEAQTEVSIGINILAIDELDLKSQMFSTVGWLTFEWTDSRISWNPASKDDIKYIFSEPDTIWKPELVIDNSLDNVGVISSTDLNLRVKYDGTVEWEPPMKFDTHCEVDITYYPYDKQTCGITIVSWGYATDEAVLKALPTPINLEDFKTHGEWIIISSSFVISNITDTVTDGTTREHSQITFWLNLKRRTEFYNLNVIVPVFLTSLLVALTFIVPVDSGEKLSYILTVFLSITVLLTLVANSLPSTSVTTSVLGLYLGIVTVLAAFAIFVTVLILLVFNRDGEPRSSFVLAISRFAAKATCLSGPFYMNDISKVTPVPNSVDEQHLSAKDTEVKSKPSWADVAQVLDRFCFMLFSILTVLVNVSFVITLAVGEESRD